ncbi:TPA: hypothetical protein VJE30_001326 [Streptococcus pyogenes]|nr:hypothetical protein [Streptococcus pyogenes]
MAKKNLTKIDLELEEAKKKVLALQSERKKVEETIYQNVGKLYVQIQLIKDKTLSYEAIQEELKTEFDLLKEEEKERHLTTKKSREEAAVLSQNTTHSSGEN